MRILPAILFLLLTSWSWSQIGMGQWRMHVPAQKAIDVAAGNGKVYVALTSGVLEYDIAASENRILNNVNHLSDIKAKCVTFEPSTNSFFIGYENGNIDQITASESIINIPAITQATVSGSKEINRIVAANNLIYVISDFGIVLIDPSKSEVRDTWYPSSEVVAYNDMTFHGDSVYVISETGLYRGKKTSQFLSNPSQWTTDTRLPAPVDAKYNCIETLGNDVIFGYQRNEYGGDSILKLTPNGYSRIIGEPELGFTFEMKNFEFKDNLIYIYVSDAVLAFNPDLSFSYFINNYGSGMGANPSKLVLLNGTKWISDNVHGLIRVREDNSFTKISSEGPPNDKFFSLAGKKGKIVVTSGIIDRVKLNYSAPEFYTFSDESWKGYSKSNQPAWGNNLWDMGSAAINPDDTNQVAIGTYSKAPLVLMNGNETSQIYTPFNSLIDTMIINGQSNGFACISDLEYDDKGNLWVVNAYTTSPLKVLLANGTWKEFTVNSEVNNKFTGKLAIDKNGNKWFGGVSGLVGYNDNGTPENVADDKHILLTNEEGNGSLPSRVVTAVAVDKDDEIWIGTESGFAVLYNSSGAFTSSTFDASQILIDYEGNVENFLNATAITDIEIDGGNRKWIATESSGIFLLSPSGQELIAEYNVDNSPLISNKVMDMEFNHSTGELFIVTDKGMVSFRTDASEEDLNYASTTVFPNPVKPDYFGPVTIQGIRFDSDVKITDIGGNLVYKTTSNGGTATWNGKHLDGSEVASGVYLIWTASNVEKARKVGKVVVIR